MFKNKKSNTDIFKIRLSDKTEIKIDGIVKEIDIYSSVNLEDVLGKDLFKILGEHLSKLSIKGNITLRSLDVRNNKVLHIKFDIDNLDKVYKNLLGKTSCKNISRIDGKELDTKDLDIKDLDKGIKESIVLALWSCMDSGVKLKSITSLRLKNNISKYTDSEYLVEIDVNKAITKVVKISLVRFIYILLIFNLIVSLVDFDKRSKDKVHVYTEFTKYLEEGMVDTVDIEVSGQYFDAYLRDKNGDVSKEPITYYSPNYEDFRKDLAEAGVRIETSFSLKAKLLTFASMSSGLVWILGLIWIVKKQLEAFSDVNTLGLDDNLDTIKDKVTFDDIAGIDGMVDDIKATLDSFVNPMKVEAMGGRVARGILLEGEPGTGKTLLAKAIANTMGANFIGLTGGDFNQLFMGAGSRKVNRVFKRAMELEPCVVFIDEIDAIGSKRGGVNDHKEYSNTLNTLLAKMDGVCNKHRILVVGATNLASSLDPALLRAGRFDKIYKMTGSNSRDSRRDIIGLHLKNKALKDGVDREQLLDNLTKVFNGLSPATIAGILSEAVVNSFNNGDKGYLDFECIDKTFTRHITRGVEDKNEGKDIDVVAVHEAGHMLLGLLNGKEVLKGTIVGSTSGIGGFALFNELDYKFKNKEDLLVDLRVCLGGLAATEVVFGTRYLGASNDLEQATMLVINLLYSSGVDGKVNGVREKLSHRDMEKVDNYINTNYLDVKKSLEDTRELLLKITNLLKEKGTVYNITLDNLN